MAHKLPKGPSSLLKTGRSSLRARPVAPTIMGPRARKMLDERVWPPLHSCRPGLNGFVNLGRYQREHVDLVPAASSLRSPWWDEVGGCLYVLNLSSDILYQALKNCQWGEAQDLEEDCLQGNLVSRTANLSLINRRRQDGQESVQLPSIIVLVPTTPSPLTDRPHRRSQNAGAMPRSGYDTTNMRLAVNPRPAASAGGTGHPRNDKPRSDGNSGGSGGGSGSAGGGRREGNGRDDGDNGSKETEEQEPVRGSKDEGPTKKKTIDDVRIPMEGRGWTFWL